MHFEEDSSQVKHVTEQGEQITLLSSKYVSLHGQALLSFMLKIRNIKNYNFE